MPNHVRRIDAFPFNNELDLLECRLVELYDSVDKFVIVEADIDHQGNQKPLYYQENKNRYSSFSDKIVHVKATSLPTFQENGNPWSREWAQREDISIGLGKIDICDDDIILQSDVDEIPTASIVKNVNPTDILVFLQRLHTFAIDWEHPAKWQGTVVSTIGMLSRYSHMPFKHMRDARFDAPSPDGLDKGGHHFSWLGGHESQRKKVKSFCHLELLDNNTFQERLNNNDFYNLGISVDGVQQNQCEIDETYPKWILEGNAPKEWYRPTE